MPFGTITVSRNLVFLALWLLLMWVAGLYLPIQFSVTTNYLTLIWLGLAWGGAALILCFARPRA